MKKIIEIYSSYIKIVGIFIVLAIVIYLAVGQDITYSVFENQSINPDPLYTVKGKDTLGIFVISSYGVGVIAFIVSLVPLTKTANDSKVRDICERLEKFYKPMKEILDNTYNMNYNVDQLVVNLRKLKQYDHLAKDLKTQELYRECTKLKFKEDDQLQEQLKSLQKSVDEHIKNYEKDLYKLYNL